ncbi:MAG: hypothetical protein C0467_08950 [Planctomycetaceae bacterium]|nr:hypothetical protein [Planctomycetaceae bacterium]
MSNTPGTVRLSDTPSGGHQVQSTFDPVFGAQAPDGSLGKLSHYKILKQLGSGGMGAVYLAQDEGLQRRVALKVMLPSAAADPLSKERFLREARASAAVRHDNVVTIYQVGEDRGIPFIAMEYLAGSPLDQFLARKGRLTVQQVLRVGLETAEGLAAAHSLGMIHRDIKPANIWLEAPRGRIKILDFGIARQVTEQPGMGLTGAGTVVGTPGYMSPEQARGKQLDPRSDLFSLGVVLYQLTTGRVPFDGDSVLAVLTALAVDDPIPVRSLNAEVPPELESLIQRMLAKKPDARPHSALTVAEELRAITNGSAVPVAQAIEQTAPQVVYVPISVTVQESFNPTEFDGLGNDATEAISVREVPEQKAANGRGLWIAVAACLLIAGLAVGGTAIALRKPTPEPVPDLPASPPSPKPKPQPNPTPTPRFDPIPSGRGLRFAPEQAVVVPGLSIPDDTPYTLEAIVTLDETFKITSPAFGTKHRMWVVLADGNQGLQWEGYTNTGGTDTRLTGTATRGKRTHVALVRSATDVRLFVDGKLVDTKPFQGSLGGSGLVSMGGERFAGIIDEFRVSKVARYDKDFAPTRLEPDRNTEVLYRFEESLGDTAKDLTGNGRDCKIGQAKWVAAPTTPVPVQFTKEEWNRLIGLHLMGHLAGQSVSEEEMALLRRVAIDFFRIDMLDDKGFEKLSRLPWVSLTRSIDIQRPNSPLAPALTDAGLSHITSFTGLTILQVPRSQVTDGGLKPLASLPKLKILNLNGSRITDKAAAQIAELRGLNNLDVSNTNFGDEGLKGLAPLAELGELKLDGTSVTDAGLESLHDRKQLKVVSVKGTQVTAEGVKKLEEAITGIKVESDAKP